MSTLPESMREFTRALNELNRVIASEVTPILRRLHDALAVLAREQYLARVKRWLPYAVAALVVGALVGWWVT